MNRIRRKQIDDLIARLEDIKTDVEHLRGEESDAYDNLPDAVRDGGKGDAMQAAVDAMDEAVDAVDGAIQSLVGAKE